MKELLYIGHFDTVDNKKEQRQYTPSAANKMRYICSAINRAGWNVTIVSPSVTKGVKCCKGKTVRLNEHTSLKLFFSFGSRHKLERILRFVFMYLQLFFYLLFHARKGQPVLVYHSLLYVNMIRFLKKIKGFKLILEVEEIYADVTGNDRDRKKEFHLFRYADAFLFPTELLDGPVNTRHKPATIIYGTYQVEEPRNDLATDDKIHCVYAGTFDPRKGGALAAAAAASLSSNYHVHIIGFGSQEQTEQINKVIEDVSAVSRASVSCDGLLEGENYIRFIQSCHIGLSTQSPDAAFNETSFPSKVLSYLANGLRVVSIRIKSLECSTINNLMYYYDENTPEAIAKAIEDIDFSSDYDSRIVIQELDSKFVNEIGNLLTSV